MSTSTSPTQSVDGDSHWVTLKSRLDQTIKDQQRRTIQNEDISLALAKRTLNYLVDIYRRREKLLEDEFKTHGVARYDIDQHALPRPEDIANMKDEAAQKMSVNMVEDLIYLEQDNEGKEKWIRVFGRDGPLYDPLG